MVFERTYNKRSGWFKPLRIVLGVLSTFFFILSQPYCIIVLSAQSLEEQDGSCLLFAHIFSDRPLGKEETTSRIILCQEPN